MANRDFRRLWSAGFVSETGDWIFMIAMPVFVYQLTGSVTATAANFILELLPGLLLSPVAGVLADRWDRRRLMIGVSLLQVLVLLPLLAVDGPGQLYLVNLVTCAQAALATVFQPAKYALLPSVVAPEDVAAANGLASLNGNLARLLGASCGGFVVAGLGLPGVLVIDAASFLVAVALLARPFGVAQPAAVREPVWRAWVAGLREIRNQRGLRLMVLPVGLIGLAQGLFAVLFIVFVTERLGGGEGETGLLRGVQAIGGIAGGALIGTLARRTDPGRLLGWALLVFSAMTAFTWNSAYVTTAIWFQAALFAVLGAPGIGVFAGRMAIVQLHTSDATRGRVLASFQSVFDGFTALGMALAGALAGLLGLPFALDVQAALLGVAGLLALWHFRPGTRAAEPAVSRAAEPAVSRAAEPAEPHAGAATGTGAASTVGTPDRAPSPASSPVSP
ncbi:MFS transporter (plasmid) [Streptomyces yangpuensis]|uniref:MFS transporter n=1 Tax=Streptomyces yangpuensis TaxID=1648182 RepID=A0ABY5Q833_9ACTN|nr:MFS transporter [Streptomyces yangpuensis]UUY52611.1 MFS transporter [Streptomyces yangpuensis]